MSDFEELLEEIKRLPEHLTGEIIEPGVIRQMIRPLAPHRRATKQCLHQLRAVDRELGGVGWWIQQETAVRFGNRMFVPDLAGWRVERCPEPPDGYPITILPDFCCEVLSRSTAREDRYIKLPHYARSDVEWVWIVDPTFHGVEVYHVSNGQPVLVEHAIQNDVKRLPPFDIDIDLSPWWIQKTDENESSEE